jgi:hypothetical protein
MPRNKLVLIGLLLSGLSLSAISAQAVTTAELRTYATQHAIGMEWDVNNDTNYNATCSVQFRKQGRKTWQEAQPLFRTNFKGKNMLAGSILFLEPGTTHEVKLQVNDPDGGNTERTLFIATSPVPTKPTNSRTLHVRPGNGGGSGTSTDPFLGIDAAQNQAQPGDTYLLAPGAYTGEVEFTVSGNTGEYIVWRGRGDGRVSIETIRINADHIWLEGLHIEGQEYGIRTYSNPVDVVISKNTFKDCNYCVYLNHGGDGWYIVDNFIHGNVDPASGDFGGEGVELNHSNNHTVAYNSITRVADGVSYPGSNCDIFGNEIFDVSDDGVEPDYGTSNNRIWGNRISNALHNGISFQPMNGAPWYILYNQVAAPLESGLKFRDSVDRALIAHNTFIGWQGVQKSGSQFLLSVQSNNNLWISMTDWYAWENGSGGAATWKTNLNYDGFDWGNYRYGFKWGSNKRYPDLASFSAATGLQKNGIRIDKDTCFESLNIPNKPPASIPRQHLTLTAGCNARNAGVRLQNINDNFLESAPDMGAYEYGGTPPHYGPRGNSPQPPPPTPPTTPPGTTLAPMYGPLLFDKQ